MKNNLLVFDKESLYDSFARFCAVLERQIMSNSKALKALALLELPPTDKPPKDSFSMSVRLPGDTAERLLAVCDLGPSLWVPPDVTKPQKPSFSRNSVVVALIEAGLEAVEAAAAARNKGKKNA